MLRKLPFFQSILTPISIGIFVYFNVGSNVVWAILPLLALLQLNEYQSGKIAKLEKDVAELKSKIEGEL